MFAPALLRQHPLAPYLTLSGSMHLGLTLSGGVAPGYFMNPLRGFAAVGTGGVSVSNSLMVSCIITFNSFASFLMGSSISEFRSHPETPSLYRCIRAYTACKSVSGPSIQTSPLAIAHASVTKVA